MVLCIGLLLRAEHSRPSSYWMQCHPTNASGASPQLPKVPMGRHVSSTKADARRTPTPSDRPIRPSRIQWKDKASTLATVSGWVLHTHLSTRYSGTQKSCR